MRLLLRVSFCAVCLLHSGTIASAQSFRVATYNFNWHNLDVPGSIKVMRQSDADIICFQEVNAAPFRQLRDGLAKDFPCSYRSNQFVFFCKVPLTEFEASYHVNYVIAAFTFEGKRVQLINTHLSPLAVPKDVDILTLIAEFGELDQKHVKETKEILRDMKPNELTIIAGDLNSGDGSNAISTFRDAGFTDCYRSVHSESPIEPTWDLSRMWDLEKKTEGRETARRVPLRLRIDYLLNSDIASRHSK